MTATDLIARVCAARGVTTLQLRARGKTSSISRPRMEAMWLVRRFTALSYPEIGVAFNRDHSTVHAAVCRIDKLIAARPAYGDEIRRIAEMTIVQQCEGAIVDSMALAAELAELRARLRQILDRVRATATVVAVDERRAA